MDSSALKPNATRTVPPIIELTKLVVARALFSGATVIDGTVGNGHDTLFLAQHVGEGGQVFGFDVQRQAIENTRGLLRQSGMEQRVTLFLAGHERMKDLLPDDAKVDAAMFNLGYLPGSDRKIATTTETTLCALHTLLPLLRIHGIITVHIYTGHPGGLAEGNAVLDWARTLPWEAWRTASYSFCNKLYNGETLLLLERLQ